MVANFLGLEMIRMYINKGVILSAPSFSNPDKLRTLFITFKQLLIQSSFSKGVFFSSNSLISSKKYY